jgi:hypothetical protein
VAVAGNFAYVATLDQAPDLLPLMTEQDQADIIAFLKLL